MTIGDRRTTERPEAARLIQEWIASQQPAAASRTGAPQHPLGELGELGGLAVDATLQRTLSGDAPTVELTMRGVPAQPATLGLDLVRVDAQSLVRQLEHRIADLPALAAARRGRRRHRRRRGRPRAARPRRSRSSTPTRCGPPPPDRARSPSRCKSASRPSPRPPRRASLRTRRAAAAAEIDRIARASFPTPVQGAPRGTAATPARRPPPAPGRDNDVLGRYDDAHPRSAPRHRPRPRGGGRAKQARSPGPARGDPKVRGKAVAYRLRRLGTTRCQRPDPCGQRAPGRSAMRG